MRLRPASHATFQRASFYDEAERARLGRRETRVSCPAAHGTTHETLCFLGLINSRATPLFGYGCAADGPRFQEEAIDATRSALNPFSCPSACVQAPFSAFVI